MGKSAVKDKSYLFALRIIKLYQYLSEHKKEYVLSKQILRCGTSVGALVREGEQAESKADFIHKMAISLKEANETEYWLNLIKDSGYIDKKMFDSIINDCKELIALLTAIIKTTKSKK
jgi:four helix bundle protein